MASDKNSVNSFNQGSYSRSYRRKYSILLERPGPNLINVCVFDEGILKVVFTAGGPGSGKSFLADLIFGVRDAAGKPYFKNASFLGRTGLKYEL